MHQGGTSAKVLVPPFSPFGSVHGAVMGDRIGRMEGRGR